MFFEIFRATMRAPNLWCRHRILLPSPVGEACTVSVISTMAASGYTSLIPYDFVLITIFNLCGEVRITLYGKSFFQFYRLSGFEINRATCRNNP